MASEKKKGIKNWLKRFWTKRRKSEEVKETVQEDNVPSFVTSTTSPTAYHRNCLVPLPRNEIEAKAFLTNLPPLRQVEFARPCSIQFHTNILEEPIRAVTPTKEVRVLKTRKPVYKIKGNKVFEVRTPKLKLKKSSEAKRSQTIDKTYGSKEDSFPKQEDTKSENQTPVNKNFEQFRHMVAINITVREAKEHFMEKQKEKTEKAQEKFEEKRECKILNQSTIRKLEEPWKESNLFGKQQSHRSSMASKWRKIINSKVTSSNEKPQHPSMKSKWKNVVKSKLTSNSIKRSSNRMVPLNIVVQPHFQERDDNITIQAEENEGIIRRTMKHHSSETIMTEVNQSYHKRIWKRILNVVLFPHLILKRRRQRQVGPIQSPSPNTTEE